MKVFILGGVKSGKSMFAQCASSLLSGGAGMKYVATMLPMDPEDDKRVVRHIQDRSGWGFDTIEEGVDLSRITGIDSRSTVLFDSVTAFVQNNIFFDGEDRFIPSEVLSRPLEELANSSAHFIAVSDYIFSNPERYSDNVENYIRILGEVHQHIAAFSDVVLECSYSNMRFFKNMPDFPMDKIMDKFAAVQNHLEYFDI